MGTIIYFVRHAESPFIEGLERTRGLSEQGKLDARKIKAILKNENLDIFISSPYERAIQTIKDLADEYAKDIAIFEDLRERAIGHIEGVSFKEAKRKVYEEFDFSFSNGESSTEAQQRAVKVLKYILDEYKDKRVVIGTHGDIMTLMMNYFDKQYGYEFWESTSMPDLYKLEFTGRDLNNVIKLWE